MSGVVATEGANTGVGWMEKVWNRTWTLGGDSDDEEVGKNE